MNKGIVYLVGAGPGDPGLLTLKGLEYIQSCEVLVYDFLANPFLINLAPDNAEIIYVGKSGKDHTMKQNEINNILVEKGKAGKRVVRLKGGDPFVFGRGGEEALYLKENGVSFEIVPGITAAVAAPAYAGIPVTHRNCNTTVTFVTGSEDPTKEESKINWEALAKLDGTLCFYMGVGNLQKITDKLMECGLSSETPAAIIRWGTHPEQETVIGTLGNISEVGSEVKPPAIIMFGVVINLREHLNWFETKPLFGQTVLVTRSRHQASKLSKLLETYGAEVIEQPTISINPPDTWEPLDKAIEEIGTYDWIIFTSVNGVDAFFKRLWEKGKDTRSLGNTKVCVIGPATKEEIESFGIKVDLEPKEFVAESVIEAFKSDVELKDKKILLPRAEEARPVLPEELEKEGAVVNEVAVYKTVMEKEFSGEVLERIKNKEVDWITFTSSSTVKNFCKLVGEETLESVRENCKLASIGPVTSQTLIENGLRVSIEAGEYTIPGLVDAILNYLELVN